MPIDPPPPFLSYITHVEMSQNNYLWAYHTFLPNSDIRLAARSLAIEIASAKLIGLDGLHRSRIIGRISGEDIPFDDVTEQLAQVYLAAAFGTREQPKPLDHRQGTVAEHIWYCIFSEQGAPFDGRPYHIQNLGRNVTDEGGDGLTILEVRQNSPDFRLWEIKKKDPLGDSASTTINRATNQLRSRAPQYLATYSTALQESSDSRISALAVNLVEHWLRSDTSAGVGVLVATAPPPSPPTRSFGALNNMFANLPLPRQKVGHWLAIDQFSTFCELVKDELWTAI